MEHWQPAAVLRIESARRDHAELAATGPIQIAAIGLDQQLDRRIGGSRRARSGLPGTPRRGEAQQIGQQVTDRTNSTRTEAGHGFEPPIVGGGLEILEGLDVQVALDACGERLADPGHCREEVLRRDLPCETLEQGETTRRIELTNQRRNALPDRGKRLEGFGAAGGHAVDDGVLESAKCLSGGAIGADPVDARVLDLEQLRLSPSQGYW